MVYIASHERIRTNDELGSSLQRAVVVHLKAGLDILPQHLPGGTEEIHESTSVMTVVSGLKFQSWILQSTKQSADQHTTIWVTNCGH
jgi:hypothetical protein